MALSGCCSSSADQAAAATSMEGSKPSTRGPRQFAVPVDSEHKAKTRNVLSLAHPHFTSFHLAWFAFFMTFTATFAPAALAPVIRDNLNLDKWQVASGGVASVSVAVAIRMFMGSVLDTVGPRFSTAGTVLLVAPAVFCMALVRDFPGFLVIRLVIGCSLCMFVCCQYWVGSMFNVRIVGTMNSLAAGWGHMGAGVTHLLMPLVYEGIRRSVPGFSAWRWAFFVPGGLFILTGLLVLLVGQDAPDGDFRDLKKSGKMARKGALLGVLRCGMGNYRTWVLFLVYGYSFGVELTIDNILPSYLKDQFEMSVVKAGILSGLFGLMNIFTPASGGILSDLAATRWGMRGRLWVLYIIQTLGGIFCLLMSYVDYSQGATVGVLLVFAVFIQQACGALYGITPFISRRAYGVVSGTVGGGGSVGAIITQLVFFIGSPSSPNLTTQEGMRWMGVTTVGVSLLVFTLSWPMWGSMLKPGNPEYAEEDYYLREWTDEEITQGLHMGSMKFAMESRSQRGYSASNSSGSGVKMSAKALRATSTLPNQTNHSPQAMDSLPRSSTTSSSNLASLAGKSKDVETVSVGDVALVNKS